MTPKPILVVRVPWGTITEGYKEEIKKTLEGQYLVVVIPDEVKRVEFEIVKP